MTKKFNLKDVTLLAVSSVNIEHTQDALMISSYEIDFGSIKLLSPARPKNINTVGPHNMNTARPTNMNNAGDQKHKARS